MIEMKPKIIVMDLDGTLLDRNKNVSMKTVSIIEECRKINIKIVLATARSKIASKRIASIIKPDFLILNDGALILNNIDEIIFKKLLTVKTSNGIINDLMCNRNNVKHIAVETENEYFNTFTEFYHQDWDYGIHYDLSKPLLQESFKISVEITEKTLPLIIEKNSMNVS